MSFDSAFKALTQKSEAELILLPQPNTKGRLVGGEGSYIEHTHTHKLYIYKMFHSG